MRKRENFFKKEQKRKKVRSAADWDGFKLRNLEYLHITGSRRVPGLFRYVFLLMEVWSIWETEK